MNEKHEKQEKAGSVLGIARKYAEKLGLHILARLVVEVITGG